MIRKLNMSELHDAAEVIRCSFATIAEEYNLKKCNCPSHPAFITDENVFALANEGMEIYGQFTGDMLAGVVGVKWINKHKCFMEKLAVLPGHRHLGIGKQLVEFSFDLARKAGVKAIHISIINENTTLKEWYRNLGFEDTVIKQYEHLPFTVCEMIKQLVAEQ